MGLATAKELAAGGAKVVIAGRDRKTLDEAVKEIGNNSSGVKTDVSKLSEIENLFADASKKFGKIDILFVNAGIGKFAPIEQSDEAMFDEVVDINFKGSFFTVKYALPFLNDGASIIFTTSAAAKIGRAGASVYGASKAALHSMPALVVNGDKDKNANFSDRTDWRADAYFLSPGPKCLLTIFGGEHILGGISGYDAAETTDESPERVAVVQQLTLAYLRTALYPKDSSWEDAKKALKEDANPKARIECK